MAQTSVNCTCPSCGAPLPYGLEQEKITCEYCGTSYSIEQLEALLGSEQKLEEHRNQAESSQWNTAAAGKEWNPEEVSNLQSYTCSSCGAEIICDQNTMATECCYCGNPTMLPGRFSGMLKPDYIIPFKKSKAEAVAALEKFYQGKRLLPNDFIKNNRMQAIQGLYVPFWLFDSAVTASTAFRAERVSVVTTSDYTITTTSFFNCSRLGKMAFDRIPVDGSKKMDDAYMESIEPFDYQELEPFQAAYLSGFLADKYDVRAEQAVGRADQRLSVSATGCLADTLDSGYARITPVRPCSIVKEAGTVKYAMVPVWILTTRYQDKPYTFMMNGQTGKIVGSLPVDKTKLLAYSVATFAAALVVLYLLLSMTIMA